MLKQHRQLSKQRSSTLAALVAFSVLMNALTLTIPLYAVQVFDRVLTSRSLETLLYLSVLAVFALSVFSILDAGRAQILARIGVYLEEHAGRLTLMQSDDAVRASPAEKVQCLRDLSSLRLFASSPAFLALFDALISPFCLLFVFLINPDLGWATTIGAFVLCGLAAMNLALTRKPLEAANASATELMGQLHIGLRNAEAIAAMGMGKAIAQMWEHAHVQSSWRYLDAQDRVALIGAFSRFARLVLQLVVLGLGALLAIQQEVSGGMMIAASLIAARALSPIDATISSWVTIAQAREAWLRISGLLASNEPRQSLPLPRPSGRVVAEALSYNPTSALKPILSEISFTLEPGEILGVVGPTASGKTTLLRLLTGVLRPTSGNVRLDGADVSVWNRADIGQYVGYLPYDVQLLPATVAENIARLRDTRPEEIISAARRAGVHEMILRLPNGYQTKLENGEMPLSGGQRQRLGLARALFGDPPLLVLDEPNANLDAQGEASLVQAIVDAKNAGAAVVVVTHRTALLQHVDKILVLREGRCDTLGTREQVLGRKERLRPNRPGNTAPVPGRA